MLAVALGYEIGSRIGIASKLRVTMHPHGTWGTVGAALAAAKLEVPPTTRSSRPSISRRASGSTSRRTMLEGGPSATPTRAFSNQLGLMAWELQASGFVGEADGVGTVYGTVIADNFQPDEMVLELGERWEIARNYFKRHAACRYTHGAFDALERDRRPSGRNHRSCRHRGHRGRHLCLGGATRLGRAQEHARRQVLAALRAYLHRQRLTSVPAFRGRLRPMRQPATSHGA